MPEERSKRQEVLTRFASHGSAVLLKTLELDDLIAELGSQDAADAFLQECADHFDKPLISNFRQSDGGWQLGGFFPAAWSDQRVVDTCSALTGVARELRG